MEQIHRRLTEEQVKFVLQQYIAGVLGAEEARSILGLGRSRFFALAKEFRQEAEGFSVQYKRESPRRLGAEVEAAMAEELALERGIIEDKRLPVSNYNYSAVRDELRKRNVEVSLNTIIKRAKELGCYHARPQHKAHERQVLTSAVGALIQHDGSTHQWSPFATEKWVLVSSIDDYSRQILFADFFARSLPGRILRPPGS